MNAFLLQLASFSFTKKSWISSGASGMRFSKFLRRIHTVISLGLESTLDERSLCTSRKTSVVPVDGVNGQDGIPSHVTVTVLQTGPDGWHERLQQLWFLQFAQETQRGATDELIGMLQVLKSQGTLNITTADSA